MMTLGDSLKKNSSLAKVSQLEWLGITNRETPLGLVELRINLRVVHNGSWMNKMSKSWLTSKIMLIKKLLLQTFCEKILKFFKIIFSHRLG